MNRIAKRDDNLLYKKEVEAMQEEIQPGDLILDTLTKPGKVKYTQIEKEWPELKDGGTIWKDCKKLGVLNDLHLSNQTLKRPWHIENIRVKRIPNERFRMSRGPLSYGGYLFKIVGIKNLVIDWEGPDHQGFLNWPEDTVFARDLFGAWFDSDTDFEGDHILYLDVEDGGSLDVRGFAAGGGSFAAGRAIAGQIKKTVRVKINNYYIWPTGGGEGLYIGSTQSAPIPQIEVNIQDGLIVGTAAEGVQLQHLVGNGIVSNLTVVNSGMNWQNGFQPYHDAGFQLSIDSGNQKINNIIIDGWGSNGIVTYGSTGAKEGDIVEISDLLFKNGGGIAHYINKSCSHGMTWKFKGITVCCLTSEYYKRTGKGLEDYMVSANNGTDLFIYENLIHDGSKGRVFQNTEGMEVHNVAEINPIPIPIYNNTGFTETSDKIKKFSSTYANYFPSTNNTPIHFEQGEIIIDDEQGEERRYCKCLVTHDFNLADNIRPKNSENFLVLYWDEKGFRNDSRQFNDQLPFRFYPPHDYRIVGEHYKNYGFRSTPVRHKVVDMHIQGSKIVFVTEKGNFTVDVEPQSV